MIGAERQQIRLLRVEFYVDSYTTGVGGFSITSRVRMLLNNKVNPLAPRLNCPGWRAVWTDRQLSV